MGFPFGVRPVYFLTMIELNCMMKRTVKWVRPYEDCYDTIGDTSAGNLTIIGNLQDIDRIDDILFVVYTERIIVDEGGKSEEVIRLISARLAASFERGVYYGKRS